MVNDANELSRLICLILTAKTVRAGLIELGNDDYQLLKITEVFPIEGENGQLKITVDNCLQALGSEAVDINQVVFCFDESWADERDVLPTKKAKIKEILEELGIEAEGFVGLASGLAQALIRLQESSEFIHLTLFTQTLEAEYFASGKSQGKAVCDRTQSLSDDLDHVIKKVTPLLAGQNPSQYHVSISNADEQPAVFASFRQVCTDYQWLGLAQPPAIEEFYQIDLIKQVMLYATEIWWQKQTVASQQDGSAFSINQNQLKHKPNSRADSIKPSVLPAVLIGIGLGLFTLFGLAYWYLGRISQVIITLVPKSIPVESKIMAELTVASSSAKYQLPASWATQNLELKGNQKTTGTATVGEKAKGKAQLINKTDQPKTLVEGTQLKAGNNLIFTLDKEAVIPATKTNTDESGTKETRDYGLLEVTLIAKEIGESSNIQADTELTVGVFDRSSYAAKTLENFSGGSSKQVSVVSQADVDNVVKQLKTQAQTQAEEIWQKQSTNGLYYTPALAVTAKATTSNPKLNEEAEQVEVTATFEVRALSYQSEAIHQLARTVLMEEAPADYQLSSVQPQILTKFESNSKLNKLDLEITSVLVPNIPTQEWSNQLLGKSTAEAMALLAAKSELVNAKVVFQPVASGWLNRHLPKDPTKIIIKTQNE